MTDCDQRYRNINTVNFRNVLGSEILLHKGYNDNPLFIYLFILFSYFCSWANLTKEVY